MSKYDELKRLAEAGLPACCGEKIPTGVEHGGDREMMCCEKWQQGEASVPAFDLLELIAENERLAAKAEKFAAIERVMEMLECDEREGGIWTACSLLISSAHKMNSGRSVVDQEGVTVAGEQLGDWRLTVERIKEAAK